MSLNKNSVTSKKIYIFHTHLKKEGNKLYLYIIYIKHYTISH